MNSTEQEGSGFESGAHVAPGFLPQSRDIHIQLDILVIFPWVCARVRDGVLKWTGCPEYFHRVHHLD